MIEPAPESPLAQLAHPTIRLASVFALVIFVPQFGLWPLALLSAGLLALRASRGWGELRQALESIWRLRWLLLAIAVLYLGFTPGQPLFAFSDLPSIQGVTEGLRRVLILVLILLAVQAVLRALGAQQLAAAIVQLAAPLRSLGLPVDRFAIRLATALDVVQRVGEQAREARDRADRGTVVQRAAQLIVDVEAAAAQAADSLGEVPRLPAVAWWAWALPALVALMSLILAGVAP